MALQADDVECGLRRYERYESWAKGNSVKLQTH